MSVAAAGGGGVTATTGLVTDWLPVASTARTKYRAALVTPVSTQLRSYVVPTTIVPNCGSSFRISYWTGVVALSVDAFQLRVTVESCTAARGAGTLGAVVSRWQKRSKPP